MKRNAALVGVWIVACVWGISGCGGAHDASDDGHAYPPTVPLAGKTMNLHVGQEMTWSGRANGSIGYHWECVMGPADGLDLTIDFVPDFADPLQHIGSGGTEHFTWRASKPGTVGVTLQRWFRGEKTDEFTVTVVVSG
ncbi:MAG: protease inhibitor I42 family protein [Armatimonadota bacterium]